MNKWIKIFVLVLASTSLTACAHWSHDLHKYQIFHNHTNDYRQAKYTQPLAIPPGYSSSKFKQYYVVPNPEKAGIINASDLIPPDLNVKKIPPKLYMFS